METQEATTQAADATTGLSVPTGGQTEGSLTAQDSASPDPSTESSEKLGWRRQLKQDYWEHEKAKGFSSPSELFEKYLEQESRLEGAIVAPGEDATEEDLAAYRSAIGVPDTPDGYQLTAPDGIAQEATDLFAKRAHEAGLTTQQAADFLQLNSQAYSEAVAAQQAETQKNVAELKKEWGGEYDAKLEAAQRVVKQIGGEAALEEFRKADIGASPAIVRFVARVAELVAEDAATSGGGPAGDGQSRRSESGFPMLNVKGPKR